MHENELYHYGVEGMKWGVRKEYEPHPRKNKYNREALSYRLNRRKSGSQSNSSQNGGSDNSKFKTAAKVGAVVAGGILASAGAYALIKTGKAGKLLEVGKNLVGKNSKAAITVETPLLKNAEKAFNNSEQLLKNAEKNGMLGDAKLFFDAGIAHKYNTANLYDDRWVKSLTPDQLKGVKTYSGNAYKVMNKMLRDPSYVEHMPSVDRPDFEKYIKDCTEALEKAYLKEDTVVHRGVGNDLSKVLNVDPEDLKDPEFRKRLIGRDFTDEGFFSAGGSTEDAWMGAKIHAYCPKGTKGMYIDPISINKGEHEILLQRNTTFKILDMATNENGDVTDIMVEVIRQELDG